MCDPVSLGIVGTLVAAGGAGISGYQSASQAREAMLAKNKATRDALENQKLFRPLANDANKDAQSGYKANDLKPKTQEVTKDLKSNFVPKEDLGISLGGNAPSVVSQGLSDRLDQSAATANDNADAAGALGGYAQLFGDAGRNAQDAGAELGVTTNLAKGQAAADSLFAKQQYENVMREQPVPWGQILSGAGGALAGGAAGGGPFKTIAGLAGGAPKAPLPYSNPYQVGNIY